MVFKGKKEVKVGERQNILELGKDTDAQICKELGGKMGSDSKCRILKTGVDDNGDVHLKVLKDKETG